MNDIEDIVHTSYKNDNKQKQILFVKDFLNYKLSSEKEYQKVYHKLRRKYKICPNKPTIRKIYFSLLKNSTIEIDNNFLKYILKKKGRSNSGVIVITILTSPTPEYTNKEGIKIKQKFSCGQNCAYCPNEPEIKLKLKIIHITKNQIEVTTEDDISFIRIISYIIKGNKIYNIESCFDFKTNSFKISFHQDINSIFQLNEFVVGIKVEQPRSYLSTEPAVIRANRNNFDPILQINDRADALFNCGHEIDKIELLVLGGTWDHYPREYQDEFIRDIYYSINTLLCQKRKKLSLHEEISLAERSTKRLIGLTLETRPDCVNLKQIRKLRNYNVTRLQLGVQHIDDKILEKIERGCTLKDTIHSNYLWKQNGGKLDIHIMPDLPGSSIETDIKMFEKLFGLESLNIISKNHFQYVLKYPELQADQLKIYPCSTVDWTKIKEWYENGSYKPYSENEEDLIRVIAYIKNNIFPWQRLNRIIRDIPNQNIIGGNKNVNLRQKLLSREDIHCQCIRCREVKNNTEDINKAELFIREYNGVKSTEYFLSFESPDQKILYGFLRLRINHTNDDLIEKELMNCSFIRELHVYGEVVKHNIKNNKVQHNGFGKKLLRKAEQITHNSTKVNCNKIAVISGVGVREYYQKNGYILIKNYMIKTLPKKIDKFEWIMKISIVFLLISIFYDLFPQFYLWY
tara:strand:- start:819 stop:2873 length:2055 start_codon:yes stop_codon:yes gene_type:complete